MPISIAVTGNGKSGSWKIRGEQLGQAIGADVIPNASDSDLARYDVSICVKRVNHACSVFDVVDCWPQPSGSKWSREQLIRHIRQKSDGFRHLICATRAMANDLGGYYLPHHYRPGIKESQVPYHVKSVGYEGSPRYLAEWEPVIMAECKARGWEWRPSAKLTEEPCDILLAVRGAEWQGYAASNWKSGVKLSNAVGSLTPLICNPEAGYQEYGVPIWTVKGVSDIAKAFDALAEHKTREMVATAYKAAKPIYSLESIANRYKKWLVMNS